MTDNEIQTLSDEYIEYKKNTYKDKGIKLILYHELWGLECGFKNGCKDALEDNLIKISINWNLNFESLKAKKLKSKFNFVLIIFF